MTGMCEAVLCSGKVQNSDRCSVGFNKFPSIVFIWNLVTSQTLSCTKELSVRNGTNWCYVRHVLLNVRIRSFHVQSRLNDKDCVIKV